MIQGLCQAPYVYYTIPSSEQVWAVGIVKKKKKKILLWMISDLSKDGYREGGEMGFKVKSLGFQSSCFFHVSKTVRSALL